MFGVVFSVLCMAGALLFREWVEVNLGKTFIYLKGIAVASKAQHALFETCKHTISNKYTPLHSRRKATRG